MRGEQSELPDFGDLAPASTPRPRGWSVNRLAMELQVDRRTATKRLANVTPVEEGPDGPLYALADAARAIFGAPAVSEVEDLKRRLLQAQAERAEIDLAERRREVVAVEAVRRAAFANGRVERESWLNWPARVGPLLAAEFGLDVVTFTNALEREVRAHMEERSADERGLDLP